MATWLNHEVFHLAAQAVIGGVWIFHGLYSKILNGIPRHQLIVARILGSKHAATATKSIGLLELLLGVWVFTGWQPLQCASVQTLAIVTMNALEVFLARELLISAAGMAALNLGFIALIWCWALFPPHM